MVRGEEPPGPASSHNGRIWIRPRLPAAGGTQGRPARTSDGVIKEPRHHPLPHPQQGTGNEHRPQMEKSPFIAPGGGQGGLTRQFYGQEKIPLV